MNKFTWQIDIIIPLIKQVNAVFQPNNTRIDQSVNPINIMRQQADVIIQKFDNSTPPFKVTTQKINLSTYITNTITYHKTHLHYTLTSH